MRVRAKYRFIGAGSLNWGERPDPSLDSFCFPGVAIGVDQDLIVRSHDEPHPSGSALIPVLSYGCDVDVASVPKRGQIAR